MEKPSDKKILLTAIIGSAILVLILVVLVSLYAGKKKVVVSKSQSISPAVSFDKESVIPTQKSQTKEIIDYNPIIFKILAYIETQKNGSFYNLSNNQKDVSYHANSYLASAYFHLFQKKNDSQYISQAINLADSLRDHCQEKKEYEKDCYFILEPYFKLYNYNKHPLHLEFIKKNLSQLENYLPDSLNAFVNLSKQYLNYYLINFDNSNYQKALRAYQKALDLLPENQNNIGLLIQNQQMFYQATGDNSWLETTNNYFDNFNKSNYEKMNSTQKLFILQALKDDSSHDSLYNQLLEAFILKNYNKDVGFVCFQSENCGANGMSLIVDNALFIDLLNL